MSQMNRQATDKSEDLDAISNASAEVSKSNNLQIPPSNNNTNNANNKQRKRPMGWIIVHQKQIDGVTGPRVSYTAGRFIKTFRKAGFDMELVNSEDIDVYLTNADRKSILVCGKIRNKPNFVLTRTGAKTDFYTLAVYRHLEKLDVPVINTPDAVDTVKDKLYTLQILAQNNIPVPKTILLKFPVNVQYVVKRLGTPVVVKLLSGMQGKGVFLARTQEELQTHCDMLESVQPDAKMIFQECITTSLGKDLRVLVVGGKVVGAMLRANEKDFRANIHRGAEGSVYKLPPSAEYIALSACRILGLDIGGVDLLFDNTDGTKFRICEVNSSPGFEGFEKAVKVDVAKTVVSFVRIKCGVAPETDDEQPTDDDEEEKFHPEDAINAKNVDPTSKGNKEPQTPSDYDASSQTTPSQSHHALIMNYHNITNNNNNNNSVFHSFQNTNENQNNNIEHENNNNNNNNTSNQDDLQQSNNFV